MPSKYNDRFAHFFRFLFSMCETRTVRGLQLPHRKAVYVVGMCVCVCVCVCAKGWCVCVWEGGRRGVEREREQAPHQSSHMPDELTVLNIKRWHWRITAHLQYSTCLALTQANANSLGLFFSRCVPGPACYGQLTTACMWCRHRPAFACVTSSWSTVCMRDVILLESSRCFWPCMDTMITLLTSDYSLPFVTEWRVHFIRIKKEKKKAVHVIVY